ncbi:MAG: family 10 glycosylhydrolase [Bacillus subtilis]|nr:family 10 glycosylhydrolase [Bacillus subtilis]
MPSASEHNGYFLDPANPQVQQYLLNILAEIANNYEVDGINIDYIRYPASAQEISPIMLTPHGDIQTTQGLNL